MATKISFLSLGLAAAMLAACGNSSPPPPKAKPLGPPVAKVEAAKPEVAPANTAIVSPPQEPPFEGYVGVAPAGKVAFGPGPLSQDTAYQQERQRMIEGAKQKQPSKPQPPATQNASQH